MNRIIRRQGNLALVCSDDGYAWTVSVPGGDEWFWHPDEGQFTARPCANPTPDRASIGLDCGVPQGTGPGVTALARATRAELPSTGHASAARGGTGTGEPEAAVPRRNAGRDALLAQPAPAAGAVQLAVRREAECDDPSAPGACAADNYYASGK